MSCFHKSDGAASECGSPRDTFGIPKKNIYSLFPFVIPHVHGSTPMETLLVILILVTPMQTCIVRIVIQRYTHHPHGLLKRLQKIH